jgi:hypothetical protein
VSQADAGVVVGWGSDVDGISSPAPAKNVKRSFSFNAPRRRRAS